jgi:hypothetical protein
MLVGLYLSRIIIHGSKKCCIFQFHGLHSVAVTCQITGSSSSEEFSGDGMAEHRKLYTVRFYICSKVIYLFCHFIAIIGSGKVTNFVE